MIPPELIEKAVNRFVEGYLLSIEQDGLEKTWDNIFLAMKEGATMNSFTNKYSVKRKHPKQKRKKWKHGKSKRFNRSVI